MKQLEIIIKGDISPEEQKSLTDNLRTTLKEFNYTITFLDSEDYTGFPQVGKIVLTQNNK